MATWRETGISRYIAAANAERPLGRDEEAKLARAWKDHGDQRAADKLIRSHLRYVISVALKYKRYGVPLSELFAEGNFGLVHALRKFDPDQGYRFVTYAAYWIRAYVLNYVIRSWSLVGGGAGALRSKVFFKLRRERVKLLNQLGDSEEAERLLAERLQVSSEQLRQMLRRLDARDLSLDVKTFDDSGSTLADFLVDTGPDQEEVVARDQLRTELRHRLDTALGQLDARERFIVEHRLLADPEEEWSLADIGRKLGVSRERARQLEVRAKGKLRHELEPFGADAVPDHAELRVA